MLNTEYISALGVSDAEYNEIIAKAAEIIKSGSVVALPTETVYGLFADATSTEAVAKIFEAKGRPQDNPLIVHIADFQDIYKLSDEVPKEAEELAKKFWPGPFTMIVKSNGRVSKSVSAGLSTIAVRMPDSKIALDVIRASKLPLAAPSANISGFPSPTSAEHVRDDMTGRIEMIIDGGECRYGVESTVLSLTGDVPRILRPGAVTADAIKAVVGAVEIDESVLKPVGEGVVVSSPGMKYRHSSPKAQVIVLRGSLNSFVEYVERHQMEGISPSALTARKICFQSEPSASVLKRTALCRLKGFTALCDSLTNWALKEFLQDVPQRRASGLPSATVFSGRQALMLLI